MTKVLVFLLQFLLFLSLFERYRALVSNTRSPPPGVRTTNRNCRNQCYKFNHGLYALTKRQLQFWEDVEDGLDDMSNFYATRGENIYRIRQFGMRARGEIELPQPAGECHEPSEEHIDGLTAKPFWETKDFSWAQSLEENAHIIQEEFESKLQQEENLFSGDSKWQNNVMGGGWSAIRLQRLGVWNMENCKEFPETYELLRSLNIPLAVRGVCFARQEGGSGVKPHSDGRNFILTSHLGLKVPDGCWIQVGNERKSWEKHKLLTLDTSYVHSTGNPTSDDRYVLIIDFWHSELTEPEQAALGFVYDLRNKFESGSVPVRKLKQPVVAKKEEKEAGIGGWWNSIIGAADDGN